MRYSIPSPVIDILDNLESAGFEAFVVGGCVRDLILGRTPKDWDVTTNAKPDEVLALFPDSFYENDFGTVGVKVHPFLPDGKTDREHDIVETTTYRTESGYSDKRRPDSISFVSTLSEDLARRDFTMNALAFDRSGKLIDLHGGESDIKSRIIRTVGDPEERFGEDALRMMRAVRFSAELSSEQRSGETAWTIEETTKAALTKLSGNLERVSKERIRDEFSRIILSNHPSEGVELLRQTGLLHFIVPELEEGVGCGQNLHHIYTVWEHNLRALATCPSRKLSVRLAALLHDVGKPRTKRGEGYRSTFYNHDHVGARMARAILTRLRYPRDIVDHATLLVDNHLFYYNVGEVTEASVRRLIRRVGLENMDDLMAVRIGDRLGSGVPKAKPYKLRHLEYMIEKVSKDPISVKMLAVGGNDLIEELSMEPGPKIGAILDVLLSEVIENPERNTKETLLKRAEGLSSEDLRTLRENAKEAIKEKRSKDDDATKKSHWVE